MYTNLYGNANVAIGDSALYLTSGSNQVAVGKNALRQSSPGNNNVAIGINSLITNTTGNNNTALGANADAGSSNLTNATAIGYSAMVGSSNTMAFGNSNITGWAFGRNSAATGVLQVGTNATNGNGAYLSASGIWTNISDQNLKENFSAIDGTELLDKISQLDITQWNYKGTDQNETHIGPMAQQFKKLFGLGMVADDKSISTLDANGIALAGIQQLNDNNLQLRKALQEQQSMIATLQKQVQAVKAEIPMQIGKQQSMIEQQKKMIEQQNQKIDMLLKEILLIKAKMK